VKVGDEPPLKFAKVHTIAVDPIPMGNRGVLELIVPILELSEFLVRMISSSFDIPPQKQR
jgi:hypothetical protein